MNSWKMRHLGSPQQVEGLTDQEIVEGVLDQQWDPTDEVMGHGETVWVPLEQHPHFAQAMADYDPPMAPPQADEARLDMNPLIDVALVLLIFFILTTTYQELRKSFPAPGASKDDVKPVAEGQLREFTILVKIKMEGDSQAGEAAYFVENERVPEHELQAAFEKWMKKTGHARLAIETDKNVPWKTFMRVQDAAAGAKITETIRITRVPRPVE